MSPSCIFLPFIQIINGGNVDLTDVSLTSTDLTVSCNERASVEVGEIYNCSGSYTVEWLDVTAGTKNSTVT